MHLVNFPMMSLTFIISFVCILQQMFVYTYYLNCTYVRDNNLNNYLGNNK